ncbi:MAG: glycosyltransferase [Flavobacteriales bacterium]|nr:glycosyltransferase [Flavobacteriales bacterium]
MRHLHVGPARIGSTTLQRFRAIQQILPDWEHELVDTSKWIDSGNRLERSVTYRFKIGPIVKKINQGIREYLLKSQVTYDLIWVDKGIFIERSTTELLRKYSIQLWHFTPDPAFLFHKSRKFNSSIALYDHVITTKKFEMDFYLNFKSADQITLVPQSIDLNWYSNYVPFQSRNNSILFVGHFEHNRKLLIVKLLDHSIPVTLIGHRWESFAENSKHPNLEYIGKGVYGKEYVDVLNQHKFALGLLSHWIPETHTTRTFEIPACGCVLFTPRTSDTTSYFSEKQAIFFDNAEEIIEHYNRLIFDPELAEKISSRGHEQLKQLDIDVAQVMSQVFRAKEFI